VIDTELRRARRSQTPVSLIMFDIDHFKDVNDRYGTCAATPVLAAVARRCARLLRGSDLKCRYGGERVPRPPARDAARRREAGRRHAAPRAVRVADRLEDESLAVTASFGVRWRCPLKSTRRRSSPRRCSALPRERSGTQLRPPLARARGCLVEPVGIRIGIWIRRDS